MKRIFEKFKILENNKYMIEYFNLKIEYIDSKYPKKNNKITYRFEI